MPLKRDLISIGNITIFEPKLTKLEAVVKFWE